MPDVADMQRRINLLEASLREMLRIQSEAAKDPGCIPPEDALEGKLLKSWRDISRKSKLLLGIP